MITVLSPGARTLIQDLGRPGHAHLGVPGSGAADRQAHRLANHLVGNPEDAATLEVALHGPTLRFEVDAALAYTGTEADLHLDDRRIPTGHTVPVRAGQTLRIGPLHGGTYGYLAVDGGIATAPVLGSRSTCTLSGLGPAALTGGDILPLYFTGTTPPWRASTSAMTPTQALPVLPGPHAHLFPDDALDVFTGTPWAVSPDTSRVGVRLTGTPLPMTADGSLPSLGMVRGAVQVPPNGLPVVLGPDHGTTGGYPVLAVLTPSASDALARLLPGAPVRFVAVSAQAADAAERATAEAMTRSVLRLDRLVA